MNPQRLRNRANLFIPRPSFLDYPQRVEFFLSTGTIPGSTVIADTGPLRRGFYNITVMLTLLETGAPNDRLQIMHRDATNTRDVNILCSITEQKTSTTFTFPAYFLEENERLVLRSGINAIAGVNNGGSITYFKVRNA